MDEIYQAPLYKRILAPLLDGAVTFLLAVGFFMLLINGAVDIGFHNLGLKLDQYQLQESSHLFDVKKDAQGNYSSIALFGYDETNPEEHSRFVTTLHDYYVDYVQSEAKSNAEFNKKYMLFDVNSLQSPVYIIENIDSDIASYQLRDTVVDVLTDKPVSKDKGKAYYEAIAHFFSAENKGVYPMAVTEFTSDSRFQSIADRLTSIERIEAMICLSAAALIFLSIPILINKNGETAFMHLWSICFVDTLGYRVRWRHKIIRSLVTLLLYASLVFLFGIPLLVNIILCLATSQKRSLLDFAAGEIAIDKKTSVILDE